MKKLVIGTLFALAATQAAGCIITTEEDYATVGATWQFQTVSLNQTTGVVTTTPDSCPPGFTTAALFNVAVDANFNPLVNCNSPSAHNSSTCFVDLYNCEDGAGVSDPLPPATYQTWISITDDSGANTYAQSLSDYLNVERIDLDFHTSIVKNGGYFIMDWDLKGATSQQPLTCAQAGATGVETVISVSGSTSMMAPVDSGAPWPCEDHYGATASLPIGSYTVSVDALNSAGALGVAPDLTNKLISGENKTTDLGTVIIPIDGM